MPKAAGKRLAVRSSCLAAGVSSLIAVAGAGAATASTLPPIRINAASPSASTVPACVTPERLMAFLAARNPAVDARYSDIARLYKQHGEAWRVRWDYAFFQMVVETNGLKFRRGDGRSGDVNPKQYNFAGLGTTGGGVPGDAYPDASTGVLAQIQHLVVYSGERIDRPIGGRTQLKQDDIISGLASVSRQRPVTFQDLSGRWAADRGYGRTIESVAERYRAMFCIGREPDFATIAPPAPPQPAVRPQRTVSEAPLQAFSQPAVDSNARQDRGLPIKAAGLGAGHTAGVGAGLPPPPRPLLMAEIGPGGRCKVLSASYGGASVVLISAHSNGEQHLTALQVPDGADATLIDSFTVAHAPGGSAIAAFASAESALDHAVRLCQSQAAR